MRLPDPLLSYFPQAGLGVFTTRNWLDYVTELGPLGPAQSDPESMYHTLLDTLPILGQGNPVSIQRSADTLEVTVENLYDERLLAGTLAACYQAVEGSEPEVTFRKVDKGISDCQILPKRG